MIIPGLSDFTPRYPTRYTFTQGAGALPNHTADSGNVNHRTSYTLIGIVGIFPIISSGIVS
jgi:hypothetical protein